MASASALKIVLSTPKNVRISASNLIAPRGLNLSLNPVGRASHSLRLSRSTLRSFHSSSSVRQSGVAAAAAAAVTLPEGLPAAVASAVSSGPAVAELQIPFSFGKKITIVFGSQTGTGKGFAHALNKDLKKKGFDARVLDLKDYDVNAMPSDGLMIFVVACFGHGEPTSNAQHFFEWMVSDRKEGWWPNVPYTIFGLGQSKQHPENYQAVARLLDKRLNDLGGKCFLERGEGDDSEDIESDFEAWTSKLMSQLKKMEQGPVFPVGVNVPAFNSPLMSSGPAATPTPAAAAATTQTVSVKENVAPAEAASPKPKASAVFFGEISKLMELHSPLSGRSVKHVEVSSHSPLNYEPGDWVGVVPENNARDVLGLAQRLGYKLHQDVDLLQHQLLLDAAVTFHSEPLGLTKDESTGQVSGNTTVPLELVLTRLVDLNSPPRRTMLRFLAQFASGDEKDKLEFLAASSPLAAQDYNSWVVAGRLTLLELLNWFPSIHNGSVPLDQLLEGITVLQPRFYSISCAPIQDPKTLSLTAAVVRYRSPHGFEHEGVTTSYLCRQKIGSRVPVFVKPSMFHLPSNPETPIVMVGAGTGLAPFRSFMQARVETRQIASCENPTISTRNLLFFGCNNRNHDFLYRSEWDKLQARCKGDFDIQPAFAFENPWRQFVQHKMIEPFNAKRIWNMLHNQKGNFYVCGDSRTVAPGALEALIHIAQTEGGLSRPDAELYFKNMQREKRYLLDVF